MRTRLMAVSLGVALALVVFSPQRVASQTGCPVGGAVLVERASGGAVISKNTIGGALLVAHSGDIVEISDNAVGGELRCDSNRGHLTIESNEVVGDVDPACQSD